MAREEELYLPEIP